MNFLDKKVEEILKNHPSGEDFFNHLDDMIRGHRSIIDAAWDKLVQWCYDEHLWINRGIPTFDWNGLILTGAFGRAVFNYMPYELRKTFEQVILVNGGLRQEDVEAQILVDKIDIDDFILFDDSEKLAALEAEGVDNWEGYSLAMKELNTGYQKDAVTDEVLIKQYCE